MEGKEPAAGLPEPGPTIAEALDALDLLGGPVDAPEPQEPPAPTAYPLPTCTIGMVFP